jgi:hypothetical protein
MPDQMLRVADVAKLLSMSRDWVRRHFARVPGVLTIKSTAKRSTRTYKTMLIPSLVLDREILKLARQ